MTPVEKTDSAKQTIQSLERGLLLLGAFRDRPTLSLAELGRVLPVHRTSTLRLVQTLEAHGFLTRDAAGRYRLGPALCQLGNLAVSRFDVAVAARPIMERLAAETGETVQLVVRDGADMLVVDGIESAHRLKVGAGRGERRPLHATAAGKCLLAALPDDQIAAILDATPLAALTPHTITEPERLLADIRTVREHGYAINQEESEPGARFVAAPVTGPDGRALAALSLGAPADRFRRPRLEALGDRLRDLSQELSARLGSVASSDRDRFIAAAG